MLALASLLIAMLSFRRVATIAAKRGGRAIATPAEARAIARAVAGWGHRVPWHAVCFQQGLAAHLMLRRRGLTTALHYGAMRDDAGALIAHVWVRSGDVDVIGCDGSERYGLLATFPPA